MHEATNVEAAAHEYVDRGWPVLQLVRGDKRPSEGLDWRSKATMDHAEVIRRWAQYPDRNVGILTGRGSGLVVVDIDGPEGEAWFEQACADHDYRETTYAVATGKGLHFYFTHDRPLTKFKPHPEVEVLADGQQVCAPPSLHPSGRTYTLLTPGLEPLPLPNWLLELDLRPHSHADVFVLQDHRPARRFSDLDQELADRCRGLATIGEGSRNNALNDLACWVGNRVAGGCFARAQVEEQLLRAGMAAGLGNRECVATIRSGLDAGIQDPWRPQERRLSPARRATRAPGVTIEWMHQVRDERPQFLWGYRLVQNSVTLLAGDSGIGKSQIALEIIKAATGAGRLPDDRDQQTAPGRAMYVSFEDGPVLGARLRNAGIDPGNVARISGPKDEHGKPTAFRLQDIAALRDQIVHAGDIRLLVIDPWANLLVDDNPNSSEAQLAALEPLLLLAEQEHVTVLVVCHVRKSREGAVKDWVAGSKALTNNVRSGLVASELKNGTRVIHHFKSNWSKPAPALGYRIDVGDDDRAVFSWTGEAKITLEELAQPIRSTKVNECRAWLRDHAFEDDEQIRTEDLKEDAKAEGFSLRTLERAKKDLVDSFKLGEVWWCRLLG
jgi:hypothetical protein